MKRVAWERPNGDVTEGVLLGWTANGQWKTWLWTGSETGFVVAEDGDPIPQIVEDVEEVYD